MSSTEVSRESFELAKSCAIWVTQDQPCNGQMVMLMHKAITFFTTQIFVFETDTIHAGEPSFHTNYREACNAVAEQMFEEHNHD